MDAESLTKEISEALNNMRKHNSVYTRYNVDAVPKWVAYTSQYERLATGETQVEALAKLKTSVYDS
jgi:hypothetical protein